jgi:hypothetical protein
VNHNQLLIGLVCKFYNNEMGTRLEQNFEASLWSEQFLRSANLNEALAKFVLLKSAQHSLQARYLSSRLPCWYFGNLLLPKVSPEASLP